VDRVFDQVSVALPQPEQLAPCACPCRLRSRRAARHCGVSAASSNGTSSALRVSNTFRGTLPPLHRLRRVLALP